MKSIIFAVIGLLVGGAATGLCVGLAIADFEALLTHKIFHFTLGGILSDSVDSLNKKNLTMTPSDKNQSTPDDALGTSLR